MVMLDEIDPITGLPKKKRRLAYVFDYESGQFVETTEEEVAAHVAAGRGGVIGAEELVDCSGNGYREVLGIGSRG